MAKRKIIWSTSEINTLLDVMIEENVMLMMDNKKIRNSEIYKMLRNRLLEFGYDRDEDQIKFKFQKLKSEYLKMSVTNNRNGSRRMDDSFYGKMDKMIKHRPASTSFKNAGFESKGDNSATSTDFEMDISTNIESSKNSTQNRLQQYEDEIIEEQEEETMEIVNVNIPLKPRSPRKNTSYQSVVKTMTQEIKTAIKEETETVVNSLDKLQKEDQKWQEKMQRNEQAFLLQLFGHRSSTAQSECYTVDTGFE